MNRLTSRLALLTASAVAGALLLAGCAGPADATSPTAAGADGSFPVTFTHMYGQTTLDAVPERVATWGWGATDAVLALGIVPVAISAMDYGGGENRIAPWVEDAIEKLGGATPKILDSSTYELSIEELLAADPDVLIAPYSGLTKEEYDAVTAAGVPVVAPEKAVWSTPWRDVITQTGTALGKESEAEGLLKNLDTQVSDAAAAHPEFAGTTVAYASDDASTFYLYLPADPRVEILEDLGFVTPASVTALDTGESTFYTSVSPETLDQIDAQVIFTQVDTPDALNTFLTSSRTRLIPAVAKGAVGAIVGKENVAAISPTALTLPYILPEIVDQLAAATAKAKS